MNGSRYAPRDPAVEAQMEDLGNNRRDYITSYDGRDALTPREERAQKLQAKHDADARRASREAAAAAGDQRAQQLNAWNNASNHILADPAAQASEDIAGGQSHRARLAAMRQSGQLRDFDDEPRPSRRPHHQSNSNFSSGNYVAVQGAAAGPSGTQRSFSNTTPRGLQSAPIPTNSSGGYAAPPRPDGRVRPHSPRSRGTVRFGGSGRRAERPSSAINNDAAQPAAARPVLQGSSTAPRTTASTSTLPRTAAGASSAARPTPSTSSTTRPSVSAAAPAPRPTTAAATFPSVNTPPTRQPTATSTATTSFARTAATTAPTTNTTAARSSPAPGAPALFTAYQPEDGIQRQMMQGQALWYAATPESDGAARFLRSHPEAAAYLREGRRRLVNEVTAIATRMDPREMDRYIQAHKERKWMVAIALKAVELLKYASDEEVHAHYAENEGHRDFYETAEVIHRPQRSPTPGASASASTTSPALSLSSASTVIAPLSQAAGAPATIGNTTRPTQTRTPANGPQTHVLASINTTAAVPAANTNQPSRVASNTAMSAPTTTTRLQAPVTHGITQQASGSVSTASSRSSLRSAATDVTIPPATQGTMNVTFFGGNGVFLGHEQITVDSPVNATLNLNSTAVDFDPRTFFASLRALLERDSTGRSRRTEATAQVTSQADDGIWGSDEEL